MADQNKSISINFKAETKNLESSLQKLPGVTDKEAKKMVKKLDKQFKKAEKSAEKSAKKSAKSWKQAGDAMGKLAAGAAVAAAGVFALNQHIADLTNELVDASTKTGIAVDTLGGLRLAAKGSGIEFANLEAGLIKLPTIIQQAADGKGKAASAFKKLGVEAKNADGTLRDTNDVFNDLTSQLRDVEDGSERSRIAMELFGAKVGQALIQSGALTAMEEFTAISREYGVKTGPEAVASAAAFQRELANLETVGVGAIQKMVGAFQGANGGVSMATVLNEITRGFIYLSSVAEDFGSLVSATFQNALAPAFALQHALNGDLSAGMALMDEQAANQVKSFEVLANTFDKAGEAVARFDELNKTAQSGGSEKPKGPSPIPGIEADDPAAALKPAIDLEKLRLEVMQMQKNARADLLTNEETIIAKYDQQLERLETIKTESEGAVSVEVARLEVIDSMERELHELRLEQAEEINEKLDKIAENEIERMNKIRQKRRDTFTELASLSASFAQTFASSIATTLENTGNLTAKQAVKLHRMMQAGAIAEIAINTSVAIMKALATLGPIAGGVAAGLLTGMGAAQAAAVASQPSPKFDMGGMVGSRDRLAPDQANAQVLRGEAVLDRATVRKVGGAQGVRQLQKKGNSDNVIVVSPFKHFDKFLSSSLRRGSRLRQVTRKTSPVF